MLETIGEVALYLALLLLFHHLSERKMKRKKYPVCHVCNKAHGPGRWRPQGREEVWEANKCGKITRLSNLYKSRVGPADEDAVLIYRGESVREMKS